MNKIIIGLVALIVILGGAYYLFANRMSNEPVVDENAGKEYTNAEYGISFMYPPGYLVEEHDLAKSGQRARHVVTLSRPSDNAGKESGGPIAISLLLVQNDTNWMSTDQWVRTSSDSNFNLSPDKGTARSYVGPREGLMYRWQGSYTGETSAVAGNYWIYAFSVTFNNENDQIVKDYRSIMRSAVFTK